MQVNKETFKGFGRFTKQSVPYWFGVKLSPPNFPLTANLNNI